MKNSFYTQPFRFVCSALIALLALVSCDTGGGRTYYMDAIAGNDTHSGTSAEEAWQSLDKANGLVLKAGDKLLLKRGGTFYGQLEITGKGTPARCIIVDAYGEGDGKPCIVGRDTSRYAVRVYNSDYVTVRNLEIVNTGKERMAGRSGLKIECTDYGTSHGIRVDAVTVRDVNGSLVKAEGGGCGILIANGGNRVPSRFDSLTIENCHILRCARNAMIWSAYYSRDNWYPSLHTVVRNNLIEEVPGDGIVPIGCDSTLIEYNVMRDCPDILPPTEAAAGIWPWSCDNTVIQFNDVSGHKAPWDGQAYDCDYNCTNTVIQYNYSHDNYGGLVLVCDAGSQRGYSLGNIGSIVRYNISIGDGIRPKETRAGMFSPGIHIGGPVKNTLVERNILHANVKPSAEIDRTMITSDSWDGYADSTVFRGNVFYTPERSRFNMTQSTHNLFEGNWYLGNYDGLPADVQEHTTSAYYEEQVLAVDPKGYNGLYKLMNEKTVGGRPHYFINPAAIETFFRKLEEK